MHASGGGMPFEPMGKGKGKKSKPMDKKGKPMGKKPGKGKAPC